LHYALDESNERATGDRGKRVSGAR
jgi:hypothetical protein